MAKFDATMYGGSRRQTTSEILSPISIYSKHNTKENSMNHSIVNYANIVNLASRTSKPQDEFVLDNLSTEIQAALGEAMQDEKKASAKAAAMEIMALVKETREKESALVEEIRSLRRKEAEIKVKLTKINEAKLFAQTSSNYIPLAIAIGHVIPAHYRRSNPEVFEIPKVVKVEKQESLKVETDQTFDPAAR